MEETKDDRTNSDNDAKRKNQCKIFSYIQKETIYCKLKKSQNGSFDEGKSNKSSFRNSHSLGNDELFFMKKKEVDRRCPLDTSSDLEDDMSKGKFFNKLAQKKKILQK